MSAPEGVITPWQKGQAALKEKYGPDYLAVLAARGRAAMAAKPPEERAAFNRARAQKSIAALREKYGAKFNQVMTAHLKGYHSGWGAVEAKYGPNWRAYTSRMGAKATLAKYIEKYGLIEGPRRMVRRAHRKAPPPPYWLSPRLGGGFTREQRERGVLHAMLKNTKASLSADLVDAVLAALPTRYPIMATTVWYTLREDYDENTSDRHVFRALKWLVQHGYVERGPVPDGALGESKMIDGVELGYRRAR